MGPARTRIGRPGVMDRFELEMDSIITDPRDGRNCTVAVCVCYLKSRDGIRRVLNEQFGLLSLVLAMTVIGEIELKR